MVARSIDLLTKAVISGRSRYTFLQKPSGETNQVTWLVRRLDYYLLDLNLRSRSKHFEHISIKHNICIHRNIAGRIWGIWNNLIRDDCCFPHEIIAELVHQEFSRSKMFLVNLKSFFDRFYIPLSLWNRNTSSLRRVVYSFFYRDPCIFQSSPLVTFDARFSLLSSEFS